MENEKSELNDIPTAKIDSTPKEEDVLEADFSSELEERRWSVISFEKCVSKNLSYVEAVQKIDEQKKQNISGLSIVTDEAAERFAAKQS